jgi:hypothetical protein
MVAVITAVLAGSTAALAAILPPAPPTRSRHKMGYRAQEYLIAARTRPMGAVWRVRL